MQIRFCRAAMIRTLAVTVAALTVIGVALQAAGDRLPAVEANRVAHLFHLDAEDNIPAWYATLTLLLCAVLLYAIARARRQQGLPLVLHWISLAAIFGFLSLDETVGIHELLNRPARALPGVTGGLLFPWVIAAAAMLAIMLGLYWPFLRSLADDTRRRFLIAACLFVCGAVGVETLSGVYARRGAYGDLNYELIAALEELLEMLGVLVFINALLIELARVSPKIQIEIIDGGQAP